MADKRQRAVNAVTVVVAVLVVLGAMLWLTGVFRGGRIQPGRLAAADSPVEGRAVAVQKVQRPHEADVIGSVQAELRTNVSARLTANIVQISVRAGDQVQHGMVLVKLDDRDLRARVEQAKESLRSAEAQRELAKLELDRFSQMAAQNVASEYELSQWRTKFAQASADVARAQQAIKEAEVGLSDTQIIAPFDGVVIDRQAEPGDQASPGRTLLTLYNPTQLRLEASLREGYIGRLKVGQEIPVHIDAVGQQRLGTVQEIVPAADPSSRSFLVKVKLADPTGLYPGMFGRMRVPLDPVQQLEVPLAAVQNVGQLDLVNVVVDQQVQKRSVRLGRRSETTVQVLAGLREGETVLAP